MAAPLNSYLNLSNQLSDMISCDSDGNYSWNGVMEFINNQMNASQERANEWKIERKKLQETMNSIHQEVQIKNKEIELLNKRVELLEEEIAFEKSKNMLKKGDNKENIPNHHHHRVKSDFVPSVIHTTTTTNSVTSSIIFPSTFDNNSQFKDPIPSEYSPEAKKAKNLQEQKGKQQEKKANNAPAKFAQQPYSNSTKANEISSKNTLTRQPSVTSVNKSGKPVGPRIGSNNESKLLQHDSLTSPNLSAGDKTSMLNQSSFSNGNNSINNVSQGRIKSFASESTNANESLQEDAVQGIKPSASQTLKINPAESISRISLAQKHALVEGVRKKANVETFVENISHNLPKSRNRSNSRSRAITSTGKESNILSKCTLRSHMDGVRGVFFSAKDPVLASVSEDCMVKLWDVRQISAAGESTHVDPYYTLRVHTGPIFTVAGNQIDKDSSCHENYLFTAGTEGVIRAWNIMHPDHVNNYGVCGNLNMLVGTWNAHEDVVWELNHHPIDSLMASSSSDGTIKIWRTSFDTPEADFELLNGCMLGAICYKNPSSGIYDIPTSICWNTRSFFGIAAGFVESNYLALFDVENTKLVSQIPFSKSLAARGQSSQLNKVISHESMKMLISGHEDKRIMFLDPNSGKLINTIVGHNDAVTGLSTKKNGNHLFSVSHDGSLRTWDLRNFSCVSDLNIHSKKYDEGAYTVSHHPGKDFIATGGADGIIKILEYVL